MAQSQIVENEDHGVLPALFAAGGRKKSRQHTMVLIFNNLGLSHYEYSHREEWFILYEGVFTEIAKIGEKVEAIFMSSWSDEYVRTNGIRVHYYRTGGSRPPLLLLHGITDSGLCWSRVAKALENDYDIIMPDARGHGFSDGPETGFSIEILAEDVVGLIEALQLQRPYILGHSMGGSTTTALAARHPAIPRAILLEDPAWRDSSSASSSDKASPEKNPWLEWLLPLRAQPRAERIATERARSHWVDEELEPWADSKDQFNLAIVEYNDPESRLRVTSWREDVPQISCPILLVTADPERGAVVTEQVAQEASGLWRHGEVAHIPGAGHNIRREQFEAYMAAITSFLRRH